MLYMISDYGETTLLNEDEYNETTILSADNGGDYNETTILSADDGGDYNETTILDENTGYGDYNETTLLCADDLVPTYAELYGMQNIITGKIDKITKTPYIMGSDKGKVDMLVNNPTVSRHHADIIYVDGKYYLVDKNSTNGTTLDGAVLEAEKPVLLYNGALIQLSEELFQFTMIGGQK